MSWIIGIDFGMKHWGLARGIYGVIEPIGVIDAVGGIPQWSDLHAIVKPWYQGHWVIGYPVDRQGNLLQPARALKRHWPFIQKNLGGTITTIDEFFTTKQSQNMLEYYDNITAQTKSHIDCLSACLILETYYDTIDIQQ